MFNNMMLAQLMKDLQVRFDRHCFAGNFMGCEVGVGEKKTRKLRDTKVVANKDRISIH